MLESSWPSEQRVKYTGSVFLDQLNVRRLRCATLRWLRNDDEGEKLELKHLPAFSVQHEAQVDWLSENWRHHSPAHLLGKLSRWFGHLVGHSRISEMSSTSKFNGCHRFQGFYYTWCASSMETGTNLVCYLLQSNAWISTTRLSVSCSVTLSWVDLSGRPLPVLFEIESFHYRQLKPFFEFSHFSLSPSFPVATFVETVQNLCSSVMRLHSYSTICSSSLRS